MKLIGNIRLVFDDVEMSPGLLDRWQGQDQVVQSVDLGINHTQYPDFNLFSIILAQFCPFEIMWPYDVPTLVLDARLERFLYDVQEEGETRVTPMAAFGVRLSPRQPGLVLTGFSQPYLNVEDVSSGPDTVRYNIGNGLIVLEIDQDPELDVNRPLRPSAGFREHRVIRRRRDRRRREGFLD